MSNIMQGSTPLNRFEFPYPATLAEKVIVTYEQNGETVIEKTDGDVSIDGGYIVVRLSQEETLNLSNEYDVVMQVKVKFTDGNVVPSNLIYASVGEVLNREVL